jgi:hypothetical protein
MKTPNKSLLGAVVGELNTYASKDTQNMIAAAPITTSKFGPSGSLKSKNITLDNVKAVMPKMSNEIFFD